MTTQFCWPPASHKMCFHSTTPGDEAGRMFDGGAQLPPRTQNPRTGNTRTQPNHLGTPSNVASCSPQRTAKPTVRSSTLRTH